MKDISTARKYGRRIVQGVVAAGAVVASAASMAAVQTIDTTEAVGQIQEGYGAGAAIGLAFLGLCVLIGVFIRLRRAGS